jgi:hypothetical protein
MKKKLLIYIPTFNRIEFLNKQLNYIYKNIDLDDNILNDFDIYINDNFSDNFKIHDNLLKYNNLNINRNISNIGGNANILLGFLLPKDHQFLWILSDDDFLNENSIFYILKNLHESNLLYHIGKYDIEITTNLNTDNFFETTKGPGFGLISNVIYNVDLIKDNIMTGFELYQSSFPHMSILLDKLREKSSISLNKLCYKEVFLDHNIININEGDYSYSYMGFIYVSIFFNKKPAKNIVLGFIKDNANLIFSYRNKSSIFKLKFSQLQGFLLFNYFDIFLIFWYKIISQKLYNTLKR